MKNLFRKAAVAAAFVAASTGSFAATIVDNWTYSIDAFWTGATFNTSGGRAGVSTYDDSTISWTDTLGNTSSLQILDNPATGTVVTNGAVVDGQTLMHNNQVVYNAQTLQTASMSANLTLTAQDASGHVETLDPLNFTIRFKETPNTGDPATCGFASVSGCDDVFVLEAGSLLNSFVYNGVTYHTEIVSSGAHVMDAATCAQAGAAAGCYGFTTPENLSTPMSFGFRLTAQVPAVPEPSTYALMALGLAGVVAMRRRGMKN